MDEKNYALADALQGNDIKVIRNKLNLTQKEFAKLVNVSVKTIERWESGGKPITGPIVTLVRILDSNPVLEIELSVPQRDFPMRIWYYYKNMVCTIIDVDERRRKVKVHNYTDDYMLRAFGREQQVTFEDYEEFLESRCFPRERDKMKLILKDLDLPFYDPLMIVEKTQGRMAEDEFWMRIER